MARTIEQALAQSVQPDEIIVFDQGDTEAAERDRIVASGGGVVRWLHGDTPSLTAARNQILAHTTCDVVAFVDDDVLLPGDFVARCSQRFEDPCISCLQIGIHQRRDDVAIEDLSCDNREQTCFPQFADEAFHDQHVLLFGCHAVRREAAISVGGYDEQFVGSAFGEDVEFGQRLRKAGHRIHHDPDWWLVHIRAPRGGCRMHEWPAWMESASIWLSIVRYGIREGRFGILFWASLRHGPLLRANVTRPWRQPQAWAAYLRGMAAGILRGFKAARSPFSPANPSEDEFRQA